MLTEIQGFITAPIFEDEDKTRIASLLNVILLALLVAAILVIVATPFQDSATEDSFMLASSVTMTIASLGLLILMHRGHLMIASALLLAGLWGVVTAWILFFGNSIQNDTNVLNYALIIVLSGLLMGKQAAIASTVINLLTVTGISYIQNTDLLQFTGLPPSFTDTAFILTPIFLVGLLMSYAVHKMEEALERARLDERNLAESNRKLEARSRRLQHRSAQLEAVAQVSRTAISIHNLESLLSDVPHLIGDLLGFYHAGIFLLNKDSEYAALRTANSEGGKQMLAAGHKLEVGGQSIVGHVIATDQPRIALDVGDDAVHFKNPFLPETRSEMALPLRVGGRVIGALDVQSKETNAFAEDDITVLQMMADHLAVTIGNARLLDETQRTTHNLSSSAAQILTATTQQSVGASEQSAAIAQTTTTVDELKTIAEQLVSRAQEVVQASQRTVEVARTGQQAVDETIVSMSQIKTGVEGIAENILALSEQTQQIGEIIATVNDIAAQSNILALNASVEAARAGEYGKGFAVVAVEVRNLAEQSRQATAQVKTILSDIQKATNATVMATERGTKGVDEGVKLAAQAGESIEQLGAVIRESAQAATQVVAGGRQQATGVEQVALAMQSINQATKQSLLNTRQSEKVAQDLNNLARHLTEIIEQYKL
jgi:methyl-accepting chemotaxis protein